MFFHSFAPSSRVLALLAALLTSTGLCVAEGPVSLMIRWLPGKTYTQETNTETVTALTALGQAQDSKMKVKQVTSIAVTEKDGGQKEARVTFEKLSGEITLNGKQQEFDSADLSQAPQMIKASVGQSVGKYFILVYDKEDQFLDVKDTGSMAPSNMGNPALPHIAEAKEVAELYRRSLEMGLQQHSVKPGDRWNAEHTLKFPSAGSVNVELRVKFDAIVNYDGHPHAKISFEGDMANDSNSIEARGVQIGKGSKVFGQILFDIDQSTVAFGAFRADINLNIPGQKPLPVRQQVTTKLIGIE